MALGFFTQIFGDLLRAGQAYAPPPAGLPVPQVSTQPATPATQAGSNRAGIAVGARPVTGGYTVQTGGPVTAATPPPPTINTTTASKPTEKKETKKEEKGTNSAQVRKDVEDAVTASMGSAIYKGDELPKGYSNWGDYARDKATEIVNARESAKLKHEKEARDYKTDELDNKIKMSADVIGHLIKIETSIMQLASDPLADKGLLGLLQAEKSRMMGLVQQRTSMNMGAPTTPSAPPAAPPSPPAVHPPTNFSSMRGAAPVAAPMPVPQAPSFQPRNASPVPPAPMSMTPQTPPIPYSATSGYDPYTSQQSGMPGSFPPLAMPTSTLSTGYSPNMGAVAANQFMS